MPGLAALNGNPSILPEELPPRRKYIQDHAQPLEYVEVTKPSATWALVPVPMFGSIFLNDKGGIDAVSKLTARTRAQARIQ